MGDKGGPQENGCLWFFGLMLTYVSTHVFLEGCDQLHWLTVCVWGAVMGQKYSRAGPKDIEVNTELPYYALSPCLSLHSAKKGA